MSINPLMYHQLIFHCSYQLRDEGKYRNILETDNWLNSVLLIILRHRLCVCSAVPTDRPAVCTTTRTGGGRKKFVEHLWAKPCWGYGNFAPECVTWTATGIKVQVCEKQIQQSGRQHKLLLSKPSIQPGVTPTNDTSVCGLIQLQSFHWL